MEKNGNIFSHLEASTLIGISKVIGDTNDGLKGPEITVMLGNCHFADITPEGTKWKRLYNAFVYEQNHSTNSNKILKFCNEYFKPSRFVDTPELFESQRARFNEIFIFEGFIINEAGKWVRAQTANTIDEAKERIGRLINELKRRHIHPKVFTYCKADLIKEDYFDIVFEAVKGLMEEIRERSGVKIKDGSDLVQNVFAESSPTLIVNDFQDFGDRTEHKGFALMLRALYSLFRSPEGHKPKSLYKITEQDACDLLSMVSYCFRRLENAHKIK